MPFFVSTKMTLKCPSNFWVRKPRDYVKSALAVSEKAQRFTHGCWQHEVQVCFLVNIVLLDFSVRLFETV